MTRSRVVLFLGIAAFICVGLASVPPAYASCSNPANAIEAENCLPGNPPSDWQITGSGDPSIQGFATDISVNAGQTIYFKVNTGATNYVIEIYRMGYYGGQGARRITVISPTVSLPQVQPACLTDNSTYLLDCGNWAVTASWQVPANATSGLYFAHLLRNDTGGDSHVYFVVRNDASTSTILYQTSDTTWQAYNDYGGHSLYGDQSEFNLPVRGLKVSYNRPSDTRNFEAATFLFNAEYPMIRWLEANGYDVSYFTGVDAVRNSSLILHHKIYMSSGHDEYWDGTQRANVRAARDAGVNLAFFSGNEMFWKTRWENSIDGTNTPYRTLVCYKESYGDAVDPLDPPIWTGTWRDPSKSPPADGGQPENAISGTLFMVNGPGADNTNLSMQVPQADGQMRFWRNTSIASLAANKTATLPSGTLGYEWDVDPENSVRPAGLFYLSTATYTLSTDFLLDYGVTYGAGLATHHMTMYRAPSGALVFGAGSVQWAWGLDSNHDGTITPAPDPDMQQATVNLFADMGAQPATLQAGLQLATQSTDTTAPVSTITSPIAGTTVNAGTPVVISGTATDSGGGVVAGVEVSTDGGQTWHPAVGRSSWSYTWIPNTVGSVALMSRAVDDSANLENPQTSGGNPPGGVVINVNPQLCPCSIWNPSIGPNTVDSGDPGAIEVGVRFRTDNDGVITGLRFYKATANSGTHVGHLWTSGGALLGTVTFTGESGSGWQQVQFSSPIPVTANTVYVASYFAPQGHYAADARYFKSAGYDDPPVQALQDGVSGADGVFSYTSTPGVFPSSTFNSTNYWVDIVFVSGTTFDITGNISGIGGLGATVTLSGAANATTTTDSKGNYQFTGLLNGTYTITPSNAGVTFLPPSQTVTLNSLSLSNVNFGSVVTSPLSISGNISGSGGPGTVVNLTGVTSLSTIANASGNYSFSGLIAGTYQITPIQAGYIFTPNSQVVTLTSFSATGINFSGESCPCTTIWQPSAIPTVADSGDPSSVEVGVKFKADLAGTIQGLRFYKATANTGTHIGHIWSSTGLLLGSATFTNESASGWQEVIFSPPVNVSGNTVYVASYFAPVGHYPFDQNFFQSAGIDNPPLHALANGVSGPDGVFAYGSSPAFPNNGFNATNYWVDVVFAPSPPHNVSGTIGGPGGSGATVTLTGGTTVSTTANANGNFSFANIYDGVYVISVSQSGYAFTSASQTVTVSGSDVTGLMFATLSNCTPCDSIWQTTSAPGVSDAGDPLSVNVGVKFRSDSDGEVTGLRFYKSALNTGTHVGTLWSDTGTLLGSVTFEGESQFGWQQASFPTPIPITANTSYVVAYLAPSGHYAADPNYFATGGTDSPPLHALANGVDGQNGVFGYGSTIVFPSSGYQADNYWVDVLFTPTGSTHAISGTISGAGGPGATVTLGGAASATVTADPNGNFTFGALADGAYTITPTQPGYAFNPGVQPVTVTGANVSSVNFGTVENCPCNTIWPASAVPTLADGGDNTSVNLGVKFRADNDGYIVGLRFYKAPLNAGVHVGTLWSDTGTQLTTATFTGESSTGWQQVLFDTAVPVTANTTYIASYLAPVGHYASDANFFANSGVDNPPLHALMNGVDGADGVFAYSSTTAFPNQSYQSANYWVDVIYAGAESYSIAGIISGPGGHGATVLLSGTSTTTTTADASGNFSFGGLTNGTYTVTPTSTLFAFSPTSQTVTVNNGHVLNVNFTSGYAISGTISGPGGPGASVSISGAASATTVADGFGNFSFTGLPNGSYTVVANNAGYVIAPASQAVTLNGASAAGINFTSTAITYSISGSISGPGGPGATVNLTGASSATVTANGSGNYNFSGLVNGSYTVTPVNNGYTFTPVNQAATVAGANVSALNFASAVQTYTISGTISGAGGAGATVNLTGATTATVTADGSGNYSFTGLANGSYFVAPIHAGYVFTPTSQAVTVAGSNATANFSSALQTYTLSGTISGPGGPGATVSLSGASTATATADGSGNFSFSGLSNGTFTITPSNAGYVFTPASQTATISGSNTSTSFSSTLQTYNITGTLAGPGGPGATVSLSGTATATTTADGGGNYSFTGLANGNYVVTPSKAGYGFSPASQALTIAGSSATANFSSSLLTYNISGTISGTGGPGATVVLTGSAAATITADTSGNFTFTSLLNGSYIVTVGNAGYVFTPASAAVVINNTSYTGMSFTTVSGCPTCDTVWPASAVPTTADSGDPTSMELGVKIRADNDGYITGLRFYKAPNNTGTHIAHLWSSTGTLLGTVTVTGESSAGWQQMLFASPIPVVANTTYVASYLAPSGHYSDDANFFATAGVDNPPLHALANGVAGPNGVFLATTTGGFPTSTNQSDNYWVDVVYTNTQGYSIVGTISGPGAAGATVNLTGAATATTTTDANGNYSFNQLANGSYTVTPSNGSDTFSPANQAVTITGAHAMNVNFTSAGPTYSLSGTISGPGGPGATVSLSGASAATTTADGSGNYSFSGLANGSYTVTPSNTGYVFTPASLAATVNGANLTAQNFTSAPQTYSLSGMISGPGGPGATVNLTGASTATTTADGSGNYSFSGLGNGNYTVSPTRSGYVFTPASQAASVNGANVTAVNFTSAPQTYSLSGTISGPGGPGATVNLTGASTATTTADGSGNYSFSGLLNGSYTVTPANSGFVFSPPSQSTTISGANITGFNFASLPTVASVTLNPASVLGGSASIGTVTLTGPAPAGGAVVTLSSSNTAAAQVPASVTVAANATTATFAVNTSPVGSNTSLTISATYGGTQSSSFTVTAAVLSSVTVNPASVLGSGTATGTVTLNGPASTGGAVVTLLSSNTAAAQVPASVTVAANATTATFTVTTSPVGSDTSLTLSGTYGGTQTVGFTVTAAVLTSVTVNPASVLGGGTATGTVTLNGPAPSGGAVVTLSSSNTAAAQVPASVTVAANATTATFTVTTSPVGSNTSLNLSATYGGTQSASFTVIAAVLSSVTVNPASVLGSGTATGTVTLNGPAPSGGAVVTLSSSNTAAAQVPVSVTVAANATTATFTVTTSPVGSNTSLTISGTYGGTQSASFTVTAATLSSVTVNPASVLGGGTATGTVTLNGPAPSGGAIVTLSSSNTAAAQVPASVTVAANATTATFTVTTSPVGSNTSLSISGIYGATQSASFTVTRPVVTSLSVNPSSVPGGATSTGTITLNGPAPAGGAVVTLSSSNTTAAQVPASVTVAANATTATFTVTTNVVATNSTVTISATYGATQTASLTVTAGSLSTVTLSPTSVVGGNSSTGTVTLAAAAPLGGAVVVLSSSNTNAAQVPPSVTVTAGATTATFTVTTNAVPSNTSVTISGTYGPTRTATLTVTAPTLTGNGLTVSPASVIGGTPSTGTVKLTSPAPAGGAIVALSSSNTAAAQVPANVTVAANATTATFTITTTPVSSNTSATITATYNNTKTANLTVTAAALSAVALNPTSVTGGNTSTGTVTLSGPAPSGGAVVTLSSNNTGAAQVPANVTVAANATTATFTVTTNPQASTISVTITASYGANRTAGLTVLADGLSSVALSPVSVIGGTSSTGTVTLSRAAPAGGALVTLSSSNTAAAQVPPSVMIAANATTATFTVTTSPVATNASVTIKGTYVVAKTATLTVTAPTLSTVSLSPASLTGGNSSTGTVTLSGPAPSGGTVVILSSANPAVAQVPGSVTVAANATTATFTVTTNPVANNTSLAIMATAGTSHSATLTVNAPVLSALSLNPTTVKGKTPSTGTVTLSGPAPAGGAVVSLSSNLTSVATVPASVTVPAGNTNATFTVTTKTVSSTTSVTISATKGATQTASLTVTP